MVCSNRAFLQKLLVYSLRISGILKSNQQIGISKENKSINHLKKRIPFLAMPQDAYEDLIREPIIQTFLERHKVKLIIFDINKPLIHTWKK